MWAGRAGVRPDPRHILKLHVRLVALPYLHADRSGIPSLAAVGRPQHPDAVPARTVAPVAGQAVLLDREVGKKQAPAVVEGKRHVSERRVIVGGQPYRRERRAGIDRVGRPTAADRNDLMRFEWIHGDGRLAGSRPCRRHGDHARAGRCRERTRRMRERRASAANDESREQGRGGMSDHRAILALLRGHRLPGPKILVRWYRDLPQRYGGASPYLLV